MADFGKSLTPDPDESKYTNQAWIDQVIGFLDASGLDDLSLVGNSMGGVASMGVAM